MSRLFVNSLRGFLQGHPEMDLCASWCSVRPCSVCFVVAPYGQFQKFGISQVVIWIIRPSWYGNFVRSGFSNQMLSYKKISPIYLFERR